jgi:hypothetical protein
MSRSGYSYDCENLGLWRQAVKRAIDGKRGRAFLREMLATLDAMPVKELIAGYLEDGGEVCALGSVGRARGIDMTPLDPEEPEGLAKAFGIAPCLVQEIEFENDENINSLLPGQNTAARRWQHMRNWVCSQLQGTAKRDEHG